VKNVRIKVKQKSAGLCACLIRQPKAKANRNKLEQGKKTMGRALFQHCFFTMYKSVFCLNEKVCKSISAHSFSLAAAIRLKSFLYTEPYQAHPTCHTTQKGLNSFLRFAAARCIFV
jgi:hypothetical protein